MFFGEKAIRPVLLPIKLYSLYHSFASSALFSDHCMNENNTIVFQFSAKLGLKLYKNINEWW